MIFQGGGGGSGPPVPPLDLHLNDVLKKKRILSYWSHPQGQGWGGGSAGKIFAIMSLIRDSFNLKYTIIMFWKSWILPFDPNPRVRRVGLGWGLQAKYLLLSLLHSWFSLTWYTMWPCSEKVIFRPFDPNPRATDSGLQSKITFDVFHIYCTSVCMRNFNKEY